MKATQLEKVLFWPLLVALALCVLGAVAAYAEVCETSVDNNGNTITDCGRLIQIEGSLTAEQRQHGRLNWIERQSQVQRHIDAEIARKHEIDIEAAKYATAIKLEEAGASNYTFNVSANSDSSSGVVNRNSNENSNS